MWVLFCIIYIYLGLNEWVSLINGRDVKGWHLKQKLTKNNRTHQQALICLSHISVYCLSDINFTGSTIMPREKSNH